MKKSIQSIFLVVLIIFISGCELNNVSVPVSKPQISQSLPIIDVDNIKAISDMSTIALEWKGISEAGIYGYHIYRSNLNIDNQKLKRVATIKNKYSSHYLDNGLKPNTQYLYAISTIGARDTESVPSQSISVDTKPRLKSVSFITSVSNLPRQIKVLWRPHSNPIVSKYIIERSIHGLSTFRRIKTIHKRLIVEYIDTDLEDNTEYAYRIKAVTFDRLKSLDSAITRARTKALPTNITNITATTDLPQIIQLNWTQPDNIKEIISYAIYVSNSKDGDFNQVVRLNSPYTTVWQHQVTKNDKIQFYKVTTIDKDNLESSKNISPIMGKTLGIPAQPIITLAMIQDGKIILNWKAGDQRTVAYNIQKVIKNNFLSSTKKIISNVKNSRFEDQDILRGVTYSYRIEAVGQNGLISRQTPPTILTIPKSIKTTNATSIDK